MPSAALVPQQEIRPPLKSESELVQLQNEINCKLQEGRFDGLNLDFDQIHRSLKYDTGVNWQIEIKLQRKNRPLFCYGEKCFKEGREHPLNKLLKLECCKFHTFCNACICDYIKVKLGKNVFDKCIPCPACEVTGYIKENSYITNEEIRKLLTVDEFNSFLL